MERITFAVVILLAVQTTALAAEQSPASAEQRIGAQLGALMIQNASQAAQIEQLQAQLSAAQQRIKELETDRQKQDAPK